MSRHLAFQIAFLDYLKPAQCFSSIGANQISMYHMKQLTKAKSTICTVASVSLPLIICSIASTELVFLNYSSCVSAHRRLILKKLHSK